MRGQTQPDRHVLRPVRHHQRDDVALAEALVQRPAGVAAGALGQLANEKRFAVREQRRRVAEPRRRARRSRPAASASARRRGRRSAPARAASPSLAERAGGAASWRRDVVSALALTGGHRAARTARRAPTRARERHTSCEAGAAAARRAKSRPARTRRCRCAARPSPSMPGSTAIPPRKPSRCRSTRPRPTRSTAPTMARRCSTSRVDGFRYSRISNPTTHVLEQRVAELEGGVGGDRARLRPGGAALRLRQPGRPRRQHRLHAAALRHDPHAACRMCCRARASRAASPPATQAADIERADRRRTPAPSSARASATRPATSATSRRSPRPRTAMACR